MEMRDIIILPCLIFLKITVIYIAGLLVDLLLMWSDDLLPYYLLAAYKDINNT